MNDIGSSARRHHHPRSWTRVSLKDKQQSWNNERRREFVCIIIIIVVILTALKRTTAESDKAFLSKFIINAAGHRIRSLYHYRWCVAVEISGAAFLGHADIALSYGPHHLRFSALHSGKNEFVLIHSHPKHVSETEEMPEFTSLLT